MFTIAKLHSPHPRNTICQPSTELAQIHQHAGFEQLLDYIGVPTPLLACSPRALLLGMQRGHIESYIIHASHTERCSSAGQCGLTDKQEEECMPKYSQTGKHAVVICIKVHKSGLVTAEVLGEADAQRWWAPWTLCSTTWANERLRLNADERCSTLLQTICNLCDPKDNDCAMHASALSMNGRLASDSHEAIAIDCIIAL